MTQQTYEAHVGDVVEALSIGYLNGIVRFVCDFTDETNTTYKVNPRRKGVDDIPIDPKTGVPGLSLVDLIQKTGDPACLNAGAVRQFLMDEDVSLFIKESCARACGRLVMLPDGLAIDLSLVQEFGAVETNEESYSFTVRFTESVGMQYVIKFAEDQIRSYEEITLCHEGLVSMQPALCGGDLDSYKLLESRASEKVRLLQMSVGENLDLTKVLCVTPVSEAEFDIIYLDEASENGVGLVTIEAPSNQDPKCLREYVIDRWLALHKSVKPIVTPSTQTKH